MDKLSLTEALVAMLVEQDGVDATNAVRALRKAQANIMTNLNVNEDGRMNFLHKQRSTDDVDNMIITATRNGMLDLFA